MDWKKLVGLGLAAAAPFTGGTSLAWGLPLILGTAGGALSGGLEGAIAGGAGAAGSQLAAGGANAAGAIASPVTTQPTGDIWSKIGGYATNPDVLKAGGAALLAATEASAQNRMNRANTRGSDLAQLQTADYLANGGGTYANPQNLPTYGLFRQPPSQNVRQTAATLQDELMKRLKQGTDPGVFENIAGPVGLFSTVYGQSRDKAKPPAGSNPGIH